MTDQVALNYPDILGAVTGGARLTLDVIQCAVSVRPAQIAAGQTFELIVLLQNASDIDVDVVLAPDLPDRDAKKNKGSFMPKSARLLVGLRPAEVGFVILPVTVAPTAAPAPDYPVGVSLDIKRMSKQRPQRVRAVEGGGTFIFQQLAKETQDHMQALRSLRFAVSAAGKKNTIQTVIGVLPPAIAGLKEYKANWVSLWTMRDYLDEYTIAQKVWPQAQSVVRQLKRDTVFMPLLKTTQERFQACGYPLHPPEAIFITKLLTVLLELGVTEPIPELPRPPWPRWFIRLCRLLFQEPDMAPQIEPLITRLLYADMVYDAIQYGFTMVSTVSHEEFGTEDETEQYAEDIAAALTEGQPLDFARAYFPMILAGVIANARVTMPREQIRETVFILSKALDTRRQEKDADNAFIFDLAQQLIDRALDTT